MDNSVDTVRELAVLARLQADFAATVPLVDPAAPVPWCGSWRVGDLVEHLAAVHHWAAAMARSEDHRPLPPLCHPLDHTELGGRYRWCASVLRETLETMDPNLPARTLLADGTVAFWSRRQLHETLIHLWDLRTAGGLSVSVAPAVWADTVDEAVTVMHPRQVRLRRAPTPSLRVALTATDVGRSWHLPAAAAARTAPPSTVDGPAEGLALLLWRRVGLDHPRLTVAGDADGLEAVLAHQFLP